MKCRNLETLNIAADSFLFEIKCLKSFNKLIFYQILFGDAGAWGMHDAGTAPIVNLQVSVLTTFIMYNCDLNKKAYMNCCYEILNI